MRSISLFLWMTELTAMQNARKLRLALAASTVLAGSALSAPAFADGPNVVTTIKPVHSIAAAVMEGVGTPHILIDGAASPHGFALKPSQAFLLEGADVVFWVGPELTSSLEKPISSMADKAARVELLDVEGIEQLKWREGDQFDSHDHGDHDDHGHDDHADHGHDDHAHDHEKTAEKHDHGHDDHDHDKDHAHDDDMNMKKSMLRTMIMSMTMITTKNMHMIMTNTRMKKSMPNMMITGMTMGTIMPAATIHISG
jgi:zinc transport system substrate-binding protein